MFVQHENLLDFIVELATQSGLKSSDEFRKTLEKNFSREDLIRETHLYTEDFFWAYRAKFSLGFSNPIATPQNKTQKPHTNTHKTPQKVERSATGFVPTYEKKDTNAKIIATKKIKSELNKLALENYDVIVPRVTSIIEEDTDSIAEFIEIMFGKVQVDIKYLPLYSKMCAQFNSKFLTFKTQLLAQCQLELYKFKPEKPVLEGDPSSEENLAEMEEHLYEIARWKEKRLASLKFVAELKKSSLIEDSIINTILKDLLSHNISSPVCEDISHACELLSLVSNVLDQKIMEVHIKRFGEFQKAGNLSTLEQVKIQNTIESHKKQQDEKRVIDKPKPEVYKPRFGGNSRSAQPSRNGNNGYRK